MCGHPSTSRIASTIGTFCRVKQECINCDFQRIWSSQPFIKNVPAGNLLLSAAILMSGSSVTKSLRLFSHLKMVAICRKTFNEHQKMYLLPSIRQVWRNHQEKAITNLKEDESVVLGGDGRADSPGHSAKYGSYTMMDLKLNKIIEIQIVQSNEVGSSYHMEKEGLIWAVNFLKENNIAISTLVTDRHCQIKKWVRENLPDTKHKFDLWHIAKGVSKKLEAVAKLISGKDVKPWIHSISNHMYWCATSTVDGDGKMMLAKWKSVGQHIQNIHTGHSDVFKECEHGELQGRERKKKWMTTAFYCTGSAALLKTLDVINNPRLCKDIVMMSEKYQTSRLEAFHSTLNHFAPKMTHFSYWGQTCRQVLHKCSKLRYLTFLAGLHYNENSDREQAITAEGKERFCVAFPKFKHGGYSVKKVYKDPTYGEF
ncbi:uncharacterized protein [Antedon mediterranea]|uniref:uncharacterized protein n=1 Tax=Antedon mediterranea TaxID=105859 RepID=UPI003AF45BAE